MLRFALLLMTSLTLALLVGCSDLGSTLDTSNGGTGGDGGGLVNPGPKTKRIILGCTNSATSTVYVAGWDLTVDPGPILGGEAFGAVLRGLVVIDESLLDDSQTLGGDGYKRLNLLDLRASVHVRSGVTSEHEDMVLTNEPIQRTCTYDRSGDTGVDAGPFPTCTEESDNEDGSNDGCTGLEGMPLPENPCGQFVTIPTSNDCAPGGLCESRGKTGFGSQCDLSGFCVSGSLELVLEAEHESYLAAGSGTVLFGWDDESTGAELDTSGGPNDGTWILPLAGFGEPGPNSFRVGIIGSDFFVAFECTMAEGTGQMRPTPDSALISFRIQTL